MKTQLDRYIDFSAGGQQQAPAGQRSLGPAPHHPGRASRQRTPAPRIAPCRRAHHERTPRIIPAAAATVLQADHFANQCVFGLLAACAAVMGATAFWQLQSLFSNWNGFVQAWTRALQG